MNKRLEAQRTLARIQSQLNFEHWEEAEKCEFTQRLEEHFERLFGLLIEIYGDKYDFYYHLQQLISVLANGYKQRTAALKEVDRIHLQEPDWFSKENMLGMACYVDLFAGDLEKLNERIPYLKELGITYLHLMPLYLSPEGESDGGYAVSDYRTVNPDLGTTEQLRQLAQTLSNAGITLVLDFVFNHTSDEHQWAISAKQGVQEFQDFYYMFPDREMPDAYERTLREIFPQVRRGSFTFDNESQKWVWTTFNNFQWDLNYSNPAVFNAITDEMLFLANLGCGALRLDALAFIWKEMGTDCENLPQAHALIQAFNACLQISAPGVVFKSEAIVHPDEVVKYISPEECQLSYNPLLMALLWNSLATRKTKLLTQSMRKSFAIDPDCAWVNYVRCHDDIGWTFDDTIAQSLGINGHDHRHFLNNFYTGKFYGSFAKGVGFQENPSTGDCRVCGSAASLAGLELAKQRQDSQAIEHAVARVLLIHSIILSIGGIPLLYSGDELGLLNDYRYETQLDKQSDDRWVHRIPVTDQDIEQAKREGTPENALACGLESMIKVRKSLSVLGHSETHIIETANEHLFAYQRVNQQGDRLLAICNFSEYPQYLDEGYLEMFEGTEVEDVLSANAIVPENGRLRLAALRSVWLVTKK